MNRSEHKVNKSAHSQSEPLVPALSCARAHVTWTRTNFYFIASKLELSWSWNRPSCFSFDHLIMHTKSLKHSAVGAPSQFNQSNRKGKKAWRKNVNIEPVEQSLEQAREVERSTGGNPEARSDKQLFTIDTAGDELSKYQLLSYRQVLR